MSKRFKNKTVVVTGASAGLGRAIVRAFAREGANLGLIARGRAALLAAEKEVMAEGGQAVIAPADVSEPEAINRAAALIENRLGPVDIWVNNAMVSVFSECSAMSARAFERVTAVTYLGQVYGCMCALKSMQRYNQGVILLVGSALAYRGIPLQSAYCGAKHGILGFFESLRAELLHCHSGIRACMVQMPAMNTPQFTFVKNKMPRRPRPMGKIYDPALGARAVLYAAAHPIREFRLGYSTWKTIWGNKVVPEYLDSYFADKGYAGQQTTEPAGPEDKNNLWEPLPGDYGARGRFGQQATRFSWTLWLAEHKRQLLPAMLLAGGLMAWGWNKIHGHSHQGAHPRHSEEPLPGI